jgi:hypothetical protein
MKHIMRRVAPPILKDVASENSISRTLGGFIAFALLCFGSTFIVMTHELVIAAGACAGVACAASILTTKLRMPSEKK